MKAVSFFRRWRQSLSDHDGNEILDSFGDGLIPEIVDLGGGISKGLGKGDDRADVRLQHGLRLEAGQVAELNGKVTAGFAIIAGCGEQDSNVGVDELAGELARGAEVEELQPLCLRVEEEIGPVRIRLHELELRDFSQAEAKDLGTDPVSLILCEVLSLGHANSFHPFHGEDLGARSFVDDAGNEKRVLFVSEKLLEALTTFGFADVVTLPSQLCACIGNSFVKIKTFW